MKVISAQNMRLAEEKANSNGLLYETMMENAGRNAAKIIADSIPYESKITILCGKGKNGGDGFVIAGVLKEYGFTDISVILALGDNKNELCIKMNEKYLSGISVLNYPELPQVCINRTRASSVIIDAVFGIGFSGEIKGDIVPLLDAANTGKKRRIAIDIPSGVDSEGNCSGIYFKADLTVTMHAFKPAHIFAHTLCGETVAADIGLASDSDDGLCEEYSTLTKKELNDLILQRKIDANKGDFGKLAVISGSYGMSGAAYFSSRAAVEAGAGIVYSVFPDSIYQSVAPRLSEPLTVACESDNNGGFSSRSISRINGIISKSTAVTLGCGLGQGRGAVELTEYIIKNSKIPLVLDADGINIAAMNKDILREAACDIIMTPHPGEMARLTGLSVSDIQKKRIGIAKEFATEYSVTLVLKGANTVVCSDDGRVFINSAGNPGLARGGSGDILCGITGAMLCRCKNPFDAACAAVYIHSLAADKIRRELSEESVTPSRLLDNIGLVFGA